MKTVTRVKTISGIEYLYEVTYYYDPEQKKTRQKSTYLGKNIHGDPVRVRELAKHPKSVYSLGEILPYHQARLELELDALLRRYFTPTEVKLIISIVYAGLINQNAFHGPSTWYQSTVLYKRNPRLTFDLQTITTLLEKIGSSQIPSLFSHNLVHFLQTEETAVYSMNIDSNIRNNELYNNSALEIGRRYENVTVIYDSKRNLPISYIPCNYSLPGRLLSYETDDVLKSLRLSTEKSLFIQNKNAYTSVNLYELESSYIPYLIPIPADVLEIKDSDKQNQIMPIHPNNSHIYNNSLIFAAPFSTINHDKPASGYLYCDPQMGNIEQRRIYEDVLQICEHLKQIHLQIWMDPSNIVKEIAGKYEPFIEWKVEEDTLSATLKKDRLEKELNKAGKFALLYSGVDLEWDTCLSHYDIQAHDSHFLTLLMERKKVFPYNIHTQAINQGLLFVSYLSLLLERWVLHKMKQSGLLDVYTPEKIFLELGKIKLIEYNKRKFTTTQLSLKQEEILKTMNVQVEY